MTKADLHVHSTFSDGSAGIALIVETARRVGLDIVAVTDHDTMAHADWIPITEDLRVICGVEVSSVHPATGTRVHLLGYGIKNPDIITEFCLPVLIARDANSRRQAEILKEAGYWIDGGKLARAGGKWLYKQHIMDWLVDTGQAGELFGEFYMRTFKNGGICDFDVDYPDCFAAVRAIKDSGGLAVLAHPGQQQSFWLVPELVKAGLDGIELCHHSHSETDMTRIRALAGSQGLFMTGGSDFHGRFEPQPFGIGDFLSDESGVEAILEFLGPANAAGARMAPGKVR